MVEPPLTEELAALEAGVAGTRRRPLGYLLVVGAVALWAANATVSKVVLQSGVSSLRLAELRATGAALLFVASVVLTRRPALKTSWAEVRWLAAFGVLGLAFVQLFYYVGITRLDIGVSLVIEYITPVFVALWARFVVKDPVRRRLWVAIGVALTGLTLVVDLWGGFSLDGLGVGACLLAAFAYTAYILIAERSLRHGRDVLSLLAWGFALATVFWSVVQPWWSFPYERLSGSVSLLGRLAEWHLPVWLLAALVVVPGTFIPFILMVTALRHLSPTRVTIVAMLEPVLASVVAFAWLEESLSTGEIVGGLLVLTGVAIAQTARDRSPAVE